MSIYSFVISFIFFRLYITSSFILFVMTSMIEISVSRLTMSKAGELLSISKGELQLETCPVDVSK